MKLKALKQRQPIIKPKAFIYDSLDVIPKKTFIRICETGDVSLLSSDETDINVLAAIWDKLFEEHLDYETTPDSKKSFRLHKAIDKVLSQHNQIKLYLEALKFKYEDEDVWMVEKIREYGFPFNDDDNENYHKSIDRVDREVNSLIMKANQLKKLLPKVPETGEQADYKIDDIMASYSVILGIGFDFNKITYTTFHAYAKQVDAKIKSLEAQHAASKTNKRR